MKEKNNLLIYIIIILLILLAVSIYMIFKSKNIEQENISAQLTNEIATNNENKVIGEIKKEENIQEENIQEENLKVEKLTDEEKTEIEEYINKTCNWMQMPLTEFKNINEADKKWIYNCLRPRVETSTYSYSTKEEIEEDLRNLFGDELIFDVEKDIKQNPDAYWPNYNPEDGKYDFPHFGTDMAIYYAINNIKKNNDNYTVNLVEYFRTDDLYEVYSNNAGDYTVVYNYQTGYDSDNHTGIFHIETSKLDNSNESHFIPDKVLNSEVLKRRDQFRSFDVTLKKDNNGKIHITESKFVRSN